MTAKCGALRDVDQEPLTVEVGGGQRGTAGQGAGRSGDEGERDRVEIDGGQWFGRCGEGLSVSRRRRAGMLTGISLGYFMVLLGPVR
ncbi:hypothetical protein [Streptomyces sp. NPDC059894]|uniref:hypothetical protein n=1 Tax=unclassified Streptomyces TaxID=2593676 RepID=UPI00364E817B